MSDIAAELDLEPVSTDQIGHRTVASSVELTPRRITAFAAGVGDFNPVYFDDTRPGGLIAHPGLIFSIQWSSRHMPDQSVSLANARRGVHAWVDARFERPLREGDVITSQRHVEHYLGGYLSRSPSHWQGYPDGQTLRCQKHPN